MFSTKKPAKICFTTAIAALFLVSLRGPASERRGDLSLLMEPDGTGVWRHLMGEFQKANPGLSVRLVEGPPATNTREDMYSTAFLSGEAGYDIVYCDVIWVPKFAAAGWLRDLSGRLSAEDRADFLPVDLQAGSYRGRLYRIPAFADAGLLYYRKDLVGEPPETFQDLMAISLEMKNRDRWGFLWQGKQYEGLVTVYLEVLWGYGGDWIDAASRRVLLESPEAVQALEFLKSTLGTISPPGVTTYIEEDTRNLFQNGHAVFLRNWPYVLTLMRQSQAPIAAQTAFVPMVHAPGKSSAATLGGWGFAISQFCPDPEGAWKLVEFLTRKEQLDAVRRRMGRIPSRRSLIPREFLPILSRARMRPPIPEYAPASDILQRWLSAALIGRVSPEEAVREAARETRLLLGEKRGGEAGLGQGQDALAGSGPAKRFAPKEQ
ncbi:MAG: ABC transporter substrate-binding protein [Acidobacteria bacterium]|nr:ABC transporter substrate-binding protein [Acidobacteriota bacterium]